MKNFLKLCWPTVISGIILFVNYITGFTLNFQFIDFYFEKILILPAFFLLIYQIYFWKKNNKYYLKTNIFLLAGLLIANFFYLLDEGILFFLAADLIYYSFMILSIVATPILLGIQLLIWLFLLFRYFRLR